MRRVSWLLLGLWCAPIAFARPLRAQSAAPPPRLAVSLMAGQSQFDLSGTGTAAMVSARLEAALERWLTLEASLSTFRPAEQFLRRVRYTLPEAQFQVQLPARRVRPYLGVGVGTMIADRAPDRFRFTLPLSGGARVRVHDRLDARSELRVRLVRRSFSGVTADWLAGIGYRW